jgi:hypothetical protein
MRTLLSRRRGRLGIDAGAYRWRRQDPPDPPGAAESAQLCPLQPRPVPYRKACGEVSVFTLNRRERHGPPHGATLMRPTGCRRDDCRPTRPAALLRSLCSRQLPQRWQQFFGGPSHEFVLGLGTDLDERHVGEAHADELPGGGDVGGRIGPQATTDARSLLLRGRRPRRRREAFWVNVPVEVAVLVLAAPFVPESRAPCAPKPDPVGQLLIVTALASLIPSRREARTNSQV